MDSEDGNESQFTLDTLAQLPEFKKGFKIRHAVVEVNNNWLVLNE